MVSMDMILYARKFLGGKSEWQMYSKRTERRWENDIKLDLFGRGREGSRWILLPQYAMKTYNGLELQAFLRSVLCEGLWRGSRFGYFIPLERGHGILCVGRLVCLMCRREKYFCQASKPCPVTASRFNDNDVTYRLLSVSCFLLLLFLFFFFFSWFFFFFIFFFLFFFFFFLLNNLSECRMVHLQELDMDARRPASFHRDLPNAVHTALITSSSGHSGVPFFFFPRAYLIRLCRNKILSRLSR